jgi:pimeloyl-ACP methyl ester carboxylesterase
VGRIGDLALLATGRVAQVAPCADVPTGELLELPGRGRTYVVDTGPARRDGPPLVLLHALGCTGLLTWYPVITHLQERYRVVTYDQRWHGQGIVSDAFSLEDCADDAVAVADALGIGRFVAVGYSMASLVAQLAWRRHPDRVAGVVLAASTTRFVRARQEPAVLRAIGERTTRAATRRAIASRAAAPWAPGVDANRWALAQFRSTAPRRLAAAAAQISRFDSSAWVGSMNVPTAVVVTARDRLIPPVHQHRLARQIPHATVYEVDAGHAACVLSAAKFTPALQAACASVAARTAAFEPR